MTNVRKLELDGHDIHWISECIDIGEKHHHVSMYLIVDGDDYVLIDSGPNTNQDSIIDEINRLTDGAGIDALVLTHADLPHTGNVRRLREEWDFDLYASFTGIPSIDPEALGLGEAISCDIGEKKRIAGRKISFHFPTPPLSDAGHEMVIFDHESRTIFVADGFGHYHYPSECADTWSDLDDGVSVANIAEYHLDALPWVQFVDPAKVDAEVEKMRENHDFACLAPIHGTPIIGEENIDAYLGRFSEAMAEISEDPMQFSSIAVR